MNQEDEKEKAKLSATLLNGLALATLIATVVAPAVQWVGGRAPLLSSGLGLVVAVSFHLGARALLSWKGSPRPRVRHGFVSDSADRVEPIVYNEGCSRPKRRLGRQKPSRHQRSFGDARYPAE